MDSEFLTAEQLAEKLQITADTVKIWARKDLIPAIRPTNKVLRFSLQDVLVAIHRKSLTKKRIHNDTKSL